MLRLFLSSDDRGVRDRERQAALVHFSSSQATEMTPHEESREPQPRQPNPRAQLIKGMGKGMTGRFMYILFKMYYK